MPMSVAAFGCSATIGRLQNIPEPPRSGLQACMAPVACAADQRTSLICESRTDSGRLNFSLQHFGAGLMSFDFAQARYGQLIQPEVPTPRCRSCIVVRHGVA